MKIINLIALFSFMVFSVNCSSFGKKMKSLVSGKKQAPAKRNVASFSQSPSMSAGPRRQYRRVTKQSLLEQSRVDSKSGSLWVMEGQGAYLFAQNIVRMIGDSLVINLDGEPRQQLETKVDVIKNLLQRLESRRRVASARAAAKAEDKDKKKEDAKNKIASKGKDTKEEDDYSKSDFKVRSVQTRIVERLIDGNYRIKGSQPFMIGKREYKVIVTGIIRQEDFTDEGISATKLMDPKFDIVSVRKS